MEAESGPKPYAFIIDAAHKWSKWAAPKQANGTFNHDNALTGDDLIDYENRQLFPYLQGFKQRATSPDTIEYKIGEISSEEEPVPERLLDVFILQYGKPLPEFERTSEGGVPAYWSKRHPVSEWK